MGGGTAVWTSHKDTETPFELGEKGETKQMGRHENCVKAMQMLQYYASETTCSPPNYIYTQDAKSIISSEVLVNKLLN
jgi:hypothetical protein